MQYLRGYQNYYNKISHFNSEDIGLFTFYQQQYEQLELIKSRRNNNSFRKKKNEELKNDIKNDNRCDNKLKIIGVNGREQTERVDKTQLQGMKGKKVLTRVRHRTDILPTNKTDKRQQKKLKIQCYTPKIKNVYFTQRIGNDMPYKKISDGQLHSSQPIRNNQYEQPRKHKTEHQQQIQRRIIKIIMNHNNKIIKQHNQQKKKMKQQINTLERKKIKFVMLSNRQHQEIIQNREIVIGDIIRKYFGKQ